MICSACQHSTDEHGLYGCTEGAEEEIAALRAKAAAFDALSAAVAREDSTDWEIYHGIENPVVIYMRATGRVISAETLAEAVRLAMEAEGEHG